jgi:hypothetical protein
MYYRKILLCVVDNIVVKVEFLQFHSTGVGFQGDNGTPTNKMSEQLSLTSKGAGGSFRCLAYKATASCAVDATSDTVH